MYKKFLIFLICLSFLISNRNDWSTSPIDNFINNKFNQMIYKNPIYLIPYDLKIGFSTFGGSNYFNNFMKGIPGPGSNPIILDNQDVNNDFILSSSERSIFFIELDILKYNFFERIYHQNIIDIHMGTGLRYSKMLSNPKAPIYGNFENKGYRFRPTIYDGFISTTFNLQYSKYFFIYTHYNFGISYSTIYESLAQQSYLNASGLNESISIGFKYIINQQSLPYNYIIGTELRAARTYLNKINDVDNVSPIEALDLNSLSLVFTFGTMFGGDKTKGDDAYKLMLNKDYISAAEKFKQYLNIYNYEFRNSKAKEMLNFCYTQIPYQFFDIGLNYFNKGDFDQALYNFEKSESIANPELILEIESYKREIALAIIADVENNLDNNSFSNALKKLNKTRSISPFLWAETDRAESKILIKKGDILKKTNNYLYAIDYYQQALELNPELFKDINEKYNELVVLIIKHINRTKNFKELYIVKDYLRYIISIKPVYSDYYESIINDIDTRLNDYNYVINNFKLKNYINDKKNRDKKKLAKNINLGMTINEIETILGTPEIKKNEDDYELWIYDIDNNSKTLFFKDYILIKMD